MGKKIKQRTASQADRERAIEASFFARRCGLTKHEALKMLRDARIRMNGEIKGRFGGRR
ncbi:hypothetical protein NKH57_17080 [Mesorhizobium sp. M1050]|uniref:hypothetical protein n=1 Tax=unclassified Mesorhizobium TaxID=325217 RepID=UPI0003CE5E39|nr:hypothetical protein [Mesorhizobium sp. LNHC252B00]ESY66334.1 hypothetical protein X743_28340 [Mesorhizobium sp. LNHC252B00]